MEFLSRFVLKVEMFAGTDIQDAASDLCQLAERVGAMCEADFNGVKVWARPGDDPVKLAEAYHQQLTSRFQHKIAQVR